MTVLLPQANDDPRAPQLDLGVGGQNGVMTDPQRWVSSSGYVRQKMLAVLVAFPTAIQYLPNAEQWKSGMKALIETTPLSITGLQSGITWEYDETPVGNAGEQYASPIGAKRAQSNPTFEWKDKYGMAITRYWTELGRMLILDPDLQVPGIVALESFRSSSAHPSILSDQQSMTVLFIEPDPTMTSVVNAWLCSNMMPENGGEIIGKREIGGQGEVPTVSIPFKAYTLIGKAVNIMAHNYLRSLALNDLRPLELNAFVGNGSTSYANASIGANGVTPDVNNVNIGLAQQITNAVMTP